MPIRVGNQKLGIPKLNALSVTLLGRVPLGREQQCIALSSVWDEAYSEAVP